MDNLSRVLNSIPRDQNPEVHDNYFKKKVNYVNSLIIHLITLPFIISVEQLNYLNQICSPYTFEIGAQTHEQNTVSHPIIKSFEILADYLSKKFESTSDQIGINLQKNISNRRHFCSVLDSRDSSRINSKVGNSKVAGNNLDSCCFGDATQCEIKCDQLLIKHVYDLSARDVAHIMYNKNSKITRLYMLLPHLLVSGKDFIMPQFDIKFVIKGDNVTMYFDKEKSLGYTHSYSKWVSWLNTNVVNVNDKSYLIEIKRFVGLLAEIHITQVDKPGRYSTYISYLDNNNMPLIKDSDYDKLYQFIDTNPNPTDKCINNFLLSLDLMYVPADFYNKVVNYALAREDKHFGRSTIANYISSISNPITVSGKMVQFGLKDFYPKELIITSLVTETAHKRSVQTRSTGYHFNNFKEQFVPFVSIRNAKFRTFMILPIIVFLLINFYNAFDQVLITLDFVQEAITGTVLKEQIEQLDRAQHIRDDYMNKAHDIITNRNPLMIILTVFFTALVAIVNKIEKISRANEIWEYFADGQQFLAQLLIALVILKSIYDRNVGFISKVSKFAAALIIFWIYLTLLRDVENIDLFLIIKLSSFLLLLINKLYVIPILYIVTRKFNHQKEYCLHFEDFYFSSVNPTIDDCDTHFAQFLDEATTSYEHFYAEFINKCKTLCYDYLSIFVASVLITMINRRFKRVDCLCMLYACLYSYLSYALLLCLMIVLYPNKSFDYIYNLFIECCSFFSISFRTEHLCLSDKDYLLYKILHKKNSFFGHTIEGHATASNKLARIKYKLINPIGDGACFDNFYAKFLHVSANNAKEQQQIITHYKEFIKPTIVDNHISATCNNCDCEHMSYTPLNYNIVYPKFEMPLNQSSQHTYTNLQNVADHFKVASRNCFYPSGYVPASSRLNANYGFWFTKHHPTSPNVLNVSCDRCVSRINIANLTGADFLIPIFIANKVKFITNNPSLCYNYDENIEILPYANNLHFITYNKLADAQQELLNVDNGYVLLHNYFCNNCSDEGRQTIELNVYLDMVNRNLTGVLIECPMCGELPGNDETIEDDLNEYNRTLLEEQESPRVQETVVHDHTPPILDEQVAGGSNSNAAEFIQAANSTYDACQPIIKKEEAITIQSERDLVEESYTEQPYKQLKEILDVNHFELKQALDIGAAPGSCTSYLSTIANYVTAVTPDNGIEFITHNIGGIAIDPLNTRNIFIIYDTVQNFSDKIIYDFIFSDAVGLGKQNEKDHNQILEHVFRVINSCIINRGNAVVKLFTVELDETKNLVSAITQNFEESYLVKPPSSKANNTEQFLVLKSYRYNQPIETVDIVKQIEKMASVIKHYNSSIFEKHDKTNILVQCISANVKMSDGFAGATRNLYPSLPSSIPLNRPVGTSIIINHLGKSYAFLITKRMHFDKPTIETFTSAYDDFIKKCSFEKIIMPKIGSGLDKLDWNNVKKIIMNNSEGKSISVYEHASRIAQDFSLSFSKKDSACSACAITNCIVKDEEQLIENDTIVNISVEQSKELGKDYAKMLQSDNTYIRKMHAKTIAGITDFSLQEFHIINIIGLAGTGKTTKITKRYPKALYVVPTNELKSDYKVKGFRAVVFSAFLQMDFNSFDTVIFDEVYQQHPYNVMHACHANKRVIITGDPSQNVLGSTEYKPVHTIDKLIKGESKAMTVSYSVLPQVCAYLNGKNYPIKTKNSRISAIAEQIGKPNNMERCIVFTRKEANNDYYITSQSVQGKRIENCNIYISANAEIILDEMPQTYLVALTRATKTLNLYYENERIQKKYSPIVKHVCKTREMRAKRVDLLEFVNTNPAAFNAKVSQLLDAYNNGERFLVRPINDEQDRIVNLINNVVPLNNTKIGGYKINDSNVCETNYQNFCFRPLLGKKFSVGEALE